MRYVPIKKAEPGMKLAYDLFDSFGRVLLSSKASLTDSYIEKLINMGFPGVYIDDKLSEGIETGYGNHARASFGWSCLCQKT